MFKRKIDETFANSICIHYDNKPISINEENILEMTQEETIGLISLIQYYNTDLFRVEKYGTYKMGGKFNDAITIRLLGEDFINRKINELKKDN